MRRLILNFLLLLPLYGNLAQAQVNNQQLINHLTAVMKEKKIPGLQIAVIKHGQTVFAKAMGLANVIFKVPVSSNTVFSINSIAKVFTATTVMQLVEDGRLQLSAPVGRYLSMLPKSWNAVTIQQLLSHTSGLPDIEDEKTNGLVGGKGEQTAWKVVQGMPLQFKRGEQFNYNATNYLLLQKVIEKITSVPFEQYVKQRQFDACGMNATFYANSVDVLSNKAPTYSYYLFDKDRGDHMLTGTLHETYEEFPKTFRTDAGIFSNTADLEKWAKKLVSGGLLKKRSSLQTMWQPVKINNGSYGGFGGILNTYALGWPFIQRKDHAAAAALGGGRAAFMIYPKDDLIVILLTNLSGCEPEVIADGIAGFYFK
jgi:CubicO group peptidase (beta-lactamase class C family)